MAVSDLDSLAQSIEQFEKSSVLCVGDLILDHFVYGKVDRISPEAPVPVLRIEHSETMLGGAGNVVRNIVSLGAKACFVSVIGDDKAGAKLTSMVGKEGNIEAYLQTEKGRISTEKTRHIASNQQLLRADHETTENITAATEKKTLKLIKSLLKQVKMVVLSDYAKGCLTPTLIADIIKEARAQKVPVIVDPKQLDYSVYKGATILTPNLGELRAATNMPVESKKDITKACEKLIKQCKLDAVIVTRSKEGISVVTKDGKHEQFAGARQEVFDVSGAGDTVIAALAVGLASGLSLSDTTYLANVAGGIVVGRIGTSRVHRTDLKTALVTHDLVAGTRKVLPASTALPQIEQWRKNGKKIGFTNGCFDLIHPGHISLLEQAKATCDRLIVGLNSDESVTRLKGKNRPVQNELSRSLVLASLEAVDMVILFREDTPIKLIKSIKPDVLVKGADYKVEEVVGGKFVQNNGGKVVLAKLSKGQSTTGIVKKLSA